MRKIIFILSLCLTVAVSGHAGSHFVGMTDSLRAVAEALPHDSTRLKILTEIVLTEQHSPRFLEYAQQLFNEAVWQKNDRHIANSAYFFALYYYNNTDEIDSVSKWVNYIKPIAERTQFWHVYFSSQKLLINSYIYNNQYEYAINEALKMKEKAEAINNLDGRAAAYQCLINAYDETNRLKEEEVVLKKAYTLFPDLDDTSAKTNILCRFIKFYERQKQYNELFKSLDEIIILLDKFTDEKPEMRNALYNNYLYAEIYYIYYYIGIKDLDAAGLHVKKASEYINSQTFMPYIILYKDACAEYYRQIKDYKMALALSDTVLQMAQQAEYEEKDYIQPLIHKADIWTEMGLYTEALPLYEKANAIQDSVNATISSKQLEEIKEMYHLNQLVLEEGDLRSYIQIIILGIVSIILVLCTSYMLRINRIRKELRISEKETKEAVSKTEEANEVKSRFLSNMSHAIRVPLNSVVGFSQLMAADVEIGEEARQEYSAIIQSNTEKLMRLVNNVLDLSRLEADMMKYQLTDYDIVQLSNDAISSARMQVPSLHIQFECSIDECTVHTDCNRLMQILISTFHCPFDALQEKQTVHFRLDRTGEMLGFKIVNSPLAAPCHAGQEASIRHEINRLLLKHFGGTYQVMSDAPEGPTILFTYPISALQ